MRNKRFSSVSFLAAMGLFAIAPVHAAATLDLFGAPLQGATRATLEPALHTAGLKPTQEGERYWADVYKVDGQLKEAKTLTLYYTSDNHFADAEYVFPSFMDAQQVSRIIRMVTSKYGQPTKVSGDMNLGSVSALWDIGINMRILVSRGWPETTTHLELIDNANLALFKKQQSAEKAAQEQQQAKSQSNAF